MAKLSEVKAAQPEWFSRKNRKFFGDVSYRVLHSKVTHKPYLIRATYAWSDMFGAERRLHYRINPLHDDLKIAPLVGDNFASLEDVRAWLKVN